MITTALTDQPPVLIVQEEEPLQLRTRRLLRERPVRLGLLIGQELHRHGAEPLTHTSDDQQIWAWRSWLYGCYSTPISVRMDEKTTPTGSFSLNPSHPSSGAVSWLTFNETDSAARTAGVRSR